MITISKKIYNEIKRYDTIYIARHIGPDPDAMGSQMGLKESISITFPSKKVYAVGSSVARFKYFGKLDKIDKFDYENSLLICVDVPDFKRVDIPYVERFKNVIKIDHHPIVDKFSEIEYIDTSLTSAAEAVLKVINDTRLKMNKTVAENLFIGIMSDSNRLMFSPVGYKQFYIISQLIYKYKLNIQELYSKLYKRPLSEVRLMGYIASNLKVTKNKFAFIELEEDIINSLKADVSSASNMINEFNNIDEILVWMFISRDEKNDMFRINIRSRGPYINEIASKYNGGGHRYASGVRTKNRDDIEAIEADLDELCKKYLKENE